MFDSLALVNTLLASTKKKLQLNREQDQHRPLEEQEMGHRFLEKHQFLENGEIDGGFSQSRRPQGFSLYLVALSLIMQLYEFY